MIRIGLRLTFNSGREGAVRLVVTAVAVALGVGLLLVTLAGINAVHIQDGRSAWLSTSEHNLRPSVHEASSDPLWGLANLDEYHNAVIERVDVAPTGPRSPVPPGIPRLPGPGQFFASPALARLLASTPPAALGNRYPGRQIGTVGPAALASPDSLVIIIGHTAAELSAVPGAHEVRSFETAPQGAPGDAHPGRMQLILAVAAGALLFPILIFIAAATRLAAARREQRFAAMRLVGATRRQVSVISAVEAWVAAVAGVALGFGLFFLLRSPVASVPFTGRPFFSSDLSLHLRDIVVVALGVPAAAAVSAGVALRRVQISPLGVSRRVTPPPPRGWRLLPLAAGIGELAFFVGRRPATTGGQIQAYGAGFVLAMTGLVVAGPWLTMVGSRVMARRTARPAVLIAGRRLSDNPGAAFRSVSGLIVALFISSAALGVITTILAYRSSSSGGPAGRNILTEQVAELTVLAGGPNGVPATSLPGGAGAAPATGLPGRPSGAAPTSLPDGLLGHLGTIPGVAAVTVIRVDPLAAGGPGLGRTSGVVDCAQLARMPALGRCAPGATVASIPVDAGTGGVVVPQGTRADLVRPAAAVAGDRLPALPVAAIYVATDGTTKAIEQTRTTLEVAYPHLGPPSTIDEISPANSELIAGWRQLADVAIVASLVIAACSLAVSVAGGLVERKRPFSLLRLTGTPLGVLRRVVALEAAVPLVVVAVTAAGTGLLAAHLFLRSQLRESLTPPGGNYYLVVAAGLALALGIVASTLPLLARITGVEAARNE